MYTVSISDIGWYNVHFDYVMYPSYKTIEFETTNMVFIVLGMPLLLFELYSQKKMTFAVWMLVASIIWKSRQAAESA